MTTDHPAEIRLLTSGDAALYRDIRLEALRLAPEAFASTFVRENAMPLPWFAERMVKGNVFGAFVADELRGVAGYWPLEGEKEDHKAALWGMYVRPWARRSGLGRRLVLAILTHAAERVEQINLSVVSSSEGALTLPECRVCRIRP